MADGFKFELNRDGVRELLRGSEMQEVLLSYARGISSRAGEGYSVHVGSNRANVSVRTESDEAMRDNLDNNTLLRSIKG